jgi:hypothetical protein
MLADRWRRSRSKISKRSCAMRASRAAKACATEVPSGKSNPARSRGATAAAPPVGEEGRGRGTGAGCAASNSATVLRILAYSRASSSSVREPGAGCGPATGTRAGSEGGGRRRGASSELRESNRRTAVDCSRDSWRMSRASSKGGREGSAAGAGATSARATAGCVHTGLESPSPARSQSAKEAAGAGSRLPARAARIHWRSWSPGRRARQQQRHPARR